MPQPFYTRLTDYYRSIGKVLRGEAAAASVFPNSTDIGISRETAYMRFLEAHVPSSCSVTLGGFVFGLDGSESRQLDIIVSAGVAPRFAFLSSQSGGKAFACIDGTVAVATIKSRLTSPELKDALDNIASLPQGQSLAGKTMPLLQFPGADDIPHKIIFATDGVSLETAMATLQEYYQTNPSIPLNRRPNTIHVAGKYVIARVGAQGAETRDGTKVLPGTFHPMAETSDAWALAEVVAAIQKNAHATTYILYTFDAMLASLHLGPP